MIDKSTIITLAKNDFKAKYAGSVFGIFWAFLQPVVTILIYWFVFGVAFKSGPVGNVPYVLWLVSGVIPWLFFSEALGGITTSLCDYSYLVKKIVFDVKILPYVRVLSSFFVHIFFVALIFVISTLYRLYPSPVHLQVFYYMAASIALVIGIGRITSALMVFFRDTHNIVGLFIQIGFWLTPIFWDISAIPENIRLIFTLNPVYYIVNGYRDTFVYGIGFWQRPFLSIYFWALTAILLFLGEIMFTRLKPHFSDVL